ncbi:MAG: precorrin-2 C(20)-methyltransferase [Veillonellales bacterium]
MRGIFYGVGVGPGDPELLTLKAVQVIQAADVIIAPKTEKKEDSVALTIARPFLKAEADIVKLVFPMVSHADTLEEAWENNRQIIAGLLDEGKKVVFLTLGDPMFYSTYIYVYRLIAGAGYSVETVPGVPAFCAIGSKLGYPIVEGDNILSIIPATMAEEKLDKILAVADHAVLMKVYKNFPQVLTKLKEHGFLEQGVMISRCGLQDEEVHWLKDLDSETRPNYLSTILTRRKQE